MVVRKDYNKAASLVDHAILLLREYFSFRYIRNSERFCNIITKLTTLKETAIENLVTFYVVALCPSYIFATLSREVIMFEN